MCNTVGCKHIGSPDPNGVYYCCSHIAKALNPRPPTPKVSFDKKSIQSDPSGLDCLPDVVLLSLYGRRHSQGLSEAEIVSKLTSEYGGDLLPNAKAISQVRSPVGGDYCDDLRRRVNRIDMVGADVSPRAAPVPHPDHAAAPAQVAPQAPPVPRPAPPIITSMSDGADVGKPPLGTVTPGPPRLR